MIAAMVILLGISLFISQETTLATMWSYQLYASFGVLGLSVVYFFYAWYEGNKFSSCTSCQIGNIIGTTAISLAKLTVVMLISYFLINP